PLLNACYISLLARSVRDFWDSPFQNARRSYGTLLVWMFVQYLAQFLVLLLPLVGKSIGSALAVALLLRFRYIYLFFELMAVAFGKKFKAAWTGSNALRRQVKWKLAPFYWIILLFNLSLYYVVNNYFSWTVLIGAIVISSVLMTLIQRSLLQLYFRAQDKAYPASETGVLSL
ncbi:MAG: hypothetical protein ACXVDB_09900, partial [Tumebacillaceae bacterium]